MITINEYGLLAVGIVWVIGVAIIYFKCSRVSIDIQEYIDELDKYDREDEYMYRQLMKDIKHDK